MAEQDVRPVTATWVKIVLAISVALNLAVVGVVVGAVAKDGRRMGDGAPKDMALGRFSEALSREDRRALRAAFLEKAPEIKDQRAAARAEFAVVVQSLRAEPFDPEAFRRALGAVEARNAARLSLGRDLIEARILGMSPEDRLAFAQRLEAGLGNKVP